jgi:hypothetical protein
MAIAYDTQHQLDHLFSSGGLDLAVRNAIINYLKEDGLLNGPNDKVRVQEGNAGGLNPNAQLLYVDANQEQVRTDAALKAIIDVGQGDLKVTGSNDVLVATGQGVNLVNLSGTTGNDQVVIGGTGTNGDTGYGQNGRDNLWDDDRHYSTLGGGDDDRWGNGGNDGRPGYGNQEFREGGENDGRPGFGNQESRDGGGNDGRQFGNDEFWGEDKHYSTLAGGYGRDSGDNWNGGGDHGNGGTVTIIAGSGNDTLVGGKENDLFELGRHGNDAISGGGGDNTVKFDDSLANASISSKGGVTTVQFSDTHQTITLSGIQTLEFTDPHGHGKG